MALIIWLSKRQPTIETSVFGAEFVAMKHSIETLRGLRYKLRMMGVPLTGPTFIYGDNKSQVTNSSRPESTLKKKCNSICYHAIRESVAMGELLISHLRTWFNLSDFLTKVTNGQKHRRLVGNVLYNIMMTTFSFDWLDQPKPSGLWADLEGTEKKCPSGGSDVSRPGARNMNNIGREKVDSAETKEADLFPCM